jgi:hypothetical protein
MVYSAGRDRRVWATDIRNPEYRTLICEEKAPVLRVNCLNIVCMLLCKIIFLYFYTKLFLLRTGHKVLFL